MKARHGFDAMQVSPEVVCEYASASRWSVCCGGTQSRGFDFAQDHNQEVDQPLDHACVDWFGLVWFVLGPSPTTATALLQSSVSVPYSLSTALTVLYVYRT